MKLLETAAFVAMCIILLRAYARNTKRQTRIVSISLAFVAIHLLHSLLSSEQLLLAGDSLVSGGGGSSPGTRDGNFGYASAVDAALIVFYNLFVPPVSDDKATNAINVIKDQMGQVSLALHRLESLGGVGQKKKGVVLYNLIGDGDAFPPDRMTDLCRGLHPGLECRRIHHYHNATESVTLRSLHDFCHSQHVKDANHTRVVYLHSKGSYHDHGKQRPWRRELTSSALHPSCLSPPDRRCEVCGAQYYTIFASMFPGNMWTAKCSYIKRLLRPIEGGEYERRREEVMEKFFLLKAQGVLRNSLGFHQDVFYGLDRYQWEHWVGSHPSILPCEMHSTRVGFTDMVEGRVSSEQHYEWGIGPRRYMVFDAPGARRPYLLRDEDANFMQYYYAAGNLVKWIGLYGEVPARDSWVWDHFPAGRRWRDLVDEHGTGAVDAMVRGSDGHVRSAFALSNHTGTAHAFDEEKALSLSKPPIVVFYHVTYPASEEEGAAAAVRAQFNALSKGRYDNATRSFDRERKILLYYTISGGGAHERESMSRLCEEYSDGIMCRRLGTYDDEFASGETLRQLHAFCDARPSFDVIYITNQLADPTAGQDRHKDAVRIKVATYAVTSKMCLPSVSCNVCGTEFYPMPFAHFVGNTFAASCVYIQDLMAPQMLEGKMRDVAGEVLLARLRRRFSTNLFELNSQNLGLGRYSVEHWIGGHPDLRPCDVAPTAAAAEGSESASSQGPMEGYKRMAAPRRGGAQPGSMNEEKESQFRTKRESAFREYHYLAGNIYKWHRLYGRAPREDGWAWRWFPDGPLWEAAARKSGANAVREVAMQLGVDGGGSMEQFWVE